MPHIRAFLLALWDLATDQEVISAEQTPAWAVGTKVLAHKPQAGPAPLRTGTDRVGQPGLRRNIW